jgi:hypothetical protein
LSLGDRSGTEGSRIPEQDRSVGQGVLFRSFSAANSLPIAQGRGGAEMEPHAIVTLLVTLLSLVVG